ncbi:hypothetical protein AB0D33_17940 [Streptomyces sp. NPDC048404]|uniref:hypothetical protein n=1 Tax=unclassified Streptomyces TaxID=2593676 RepID=UPI003426FBF2
MAEAVHAMPCGFPHLAADPVPKNSPNNSPVLARVHAVQDDGARPAQVPPLTDADAAARLTATAAADARRARQ